MKAQIKDYKEEKYVQQIKHSQSKYISAIKKCKKKLDKLERSKSDPEQVYIISKQERYQQQTQENLKVLERRKKQLKEIEDAERQASFEFT